MTTDNLNTESDVEIDTLQDEVTQLRARLAAVEREKAALVAVVNAKHQPVTDCLCAVCEVGRERDAATKRAEEAEALAKREERNWRLAECRCDNLLADRDAYRKRAEEAEARLKEALGIAELSGEAIMEIRRLLTEAGIPGADFVDDHVRNAVVARNRERARAEAAEARVRELEGVAPQIAVTMATANAALGQVTAERDTLRAQLRTAREALRTTAKCRRCGGDGRVPKSCPDPQCGDSTWDHDCEAGDMVTCPDCKGAKLAPEALAALSETAPAPRHECEDGDVMGCTDPSCPSNTPAAPTPAGGPGEAPAWSLKCIHCGGVGDAHVAPCLAAPPPPAEPEGPRYTLDEIWKAGSLADIQYGADAPRGTWKHAFRRALTQGTP